MKKFFVFIVFLILVIPSYAVTLTGGVVYTVETARKEAFANVEYTIDKSIIDSNLVDPNFKENKKAIRKKISKLPDRYITYFSDGGYGIVYKKDLHTEYYYNQDGSLDHLARIEKLSFPSRKIKYDTNGRLIRIVLSLSNNEAYIFFLDGQLESHWLNNKEYDLNGKVINQSY